MSKVATKRTDAEATVADHNFRPPRLYFAGQPPNSLQSFPKLKTLCDARLAGRHELAAIRRHRQPVRAKRPVRANRAEIVAVTALLRQLPAPLRRLIGGLSDGVRVLMGLNLKPRRGRQTWA